MDPKVIFPFAVNKQREKVTLFDSTHQWGYTRDNVDYIDLSLGSCGCLPLGFKRTDFFNVVQERLQEFPFISGEFLTTNQYVVELAKRLYDLSGHYRSVFALSGSDAIETAIKTAKHYQGNKKQYIIGFENSYHGCTYLSSSVSGTTYLHETYGRDPNCITVPWDLDEVERTMKTHAGNVSCLVIESCSWQAGLHSYDNSWWQRLEQLCRSNGVVFIVDDIAFCGGKTGKFFGYNSSITPDMICVGKAFSGGYYPLSACLVNETIYDVVKETRYFHGFSYSFNMSGIISTLHYLDVLSSENVYENYQVVVSTADNIFKSLKYSCLTGIRNYGLTWCLDIKTSVLTDEDISKLFLDNGLFLGVWNSPTHTGQLLIHVPNILDDAYFDQLEKRVNAVLGALSDIV